MPRVDRARPSLLYDLQLKKPKRLVGWWAGEIYLSLKGTRAYQLPREHVDWLTHANLPPLRKYPSPSSVSFIIIGANVAVKVQSIESTNSHRFC